MRSVDLAVYADSLAGEAAALSARLERARRRLREAAIEHDARRALPPPTVARLEALGLLCARITDEHAVEIREIQAALGAVEELQAWAERELVASARSEGSVAGERLRT